MNCWNSPLVEVVARVPLGITGYSGSLGPTVLGGTFLREREPGAISVEWSLLLSNWASPNGLADPLSLEKLEL